MNGGKWVLRRYIGDGKYTVETIGTTDDHSSADGIEILDFYQAQTKARELAAGNRQASAKTAPLTVARAMEAYFGRLEHERSKSIADARNRAEMHILPKLGDILVADLTRERIGRWLKEMAERPRHVRGRAGKEARALPGPASDEEKRRRRATANRTMTVLRAALNQAFKDGEIDSDVAWRAVKPFKEVETARLRYFTQDEVRRLVNAAQGEFRDLFNAALFTGCRYGELRQLRVGDFNPDAGTVFVAQSKSGRARHVVLTEEGQGFFRQIAAGRSSDALMLAKADGSAWRSSHQLRPMEGACIAGRIGKAGFHILRHTAASHLVMAGVALAVVAKNLGHADSRMTERHYAHLAPSYVAETIRKFAPTFGTVEKINVPAVERARK